MLSLPVPSRAAFPCAFSQPHFWKGVTMRHLKSIWCLLFIAFAVSAFSAPARALNAVSWVSGTGSGTACTRTAPCADFTTALAITQINGEIRCADAGNNFGGTSQQGTIIQKSMTIDCSDVPAVVIANFQCFDIILNTSLANDPTQTVKIRGVTCDGLRVPGTVGVQIANAASVYL